MPSSKNNLRKYSPQLYIVTILFLITFGIFIRTFQYYINHSIWVDEAMLANNIMERSYLQLFNVLSYNQVAPIGFLILTKFLVETFGESEYIWRLIPFLSGVLALPICFKLYSKYANRTVSLIAMLFLVCSEVIVRYTFELKQYSSDLLICAIVLSGILLMYEKSMSLKNAVIFGILGSIAFLFSFPSIFFLLTAIILFQIDYIRRKDWKSIRNSIVTYTFWFATFIFLYIFLLQDIPNKQNLVTFWDTGFMPLKYSSIKDFKWFTDALHNLMLIPGGFRAPVQAAILFVFGTIAVCKRNKKLFFVLLLPLLITMLSSAFKIYPFEKRVMIFYAPLIFWFVSEGFYYLLSRKAVIPKILGFILFACLLFYSIPKNLIKITKPVLLEEVRPLLRTMTTMLRENDKIYVYEGANPAYQFYKNRFGLEKIPYIIGDSHRENWELYKNDLSKYIGTKRMWFLFSHIYVKGDKNEAGYMIDYLNEIGKQLLYFKSIRSVLILYDLRPEDEINSDIDLE